MSRINAPADHHHDASRNDRVQGGVEARRDGRIAGAGVRHAEAHSNPLRLHRGGGEEDAPLLPQDVRIVGVGPAEPAFLGKAHEIDEP
jgi:hypothetical protein